MIIEFIQLLLYIFDVYNFILYILHILRIIFPWTENLSSGVRHFV
jgi:hypothetical protein